MKNTNSTKNVQIVQMIIFSVLFILVFRLLFISVFLHNEYTEEANRQYREIYENRGIIYDRNMIKIRQNNNGILNHLMGYVSASGNYGIENAFDSHLSYADGRSGISLTIDYHIQKTVERIMDESDLNGAVIILDVKTGDVLAMASRPDFNTNNSTDYLNSNGAMMNKAICAYNAGSVFKVVTAAAALETNCSEEMTFICEGKKEIDEMDFVCNKPEGHGVVAFAEAMAKSCNCAFYDLGIYVGGNAVCEFAHKFGFGNYVLNITGIGESKGNVPSREVYTGRETANIAIGQGDILVTPLQVADMILTVVNDGVRKQIRIINGTVNKEGEVQQTKGFDMGRVISSSTARKLKEMLVLSVTDGTGSNALFDNNGAGGKTGTAQTGWLKGGETMTHGWFAGFFPAEKPKYVCVVFAENGKSGNMVAAPVFKKVGESINFR